MSPQGTQIALLKVTATISETDVEAAMRQTIDDSAAIACVPHDPTDQVPPALTIASDVVAKQVDLGSILGRLEGFMRLADLTAEV